MTKFGVCRTCALRGTSQLDPAQSICTVSKREIPDMTTDKCPWYFSTTEIRTCDFCGVAYEKLTIDITDPDNPKFICDQCSRLFGTCHLCKNGNVCAFHADQSSPDQIMRQFRQGNMIGQAPVRNPDKTAIYCTECCCWNKEEKYCYKEEFQMCGRYEEDVV